MPTFPAEEVFLHRTQAKQDARKRVAAAFVLCEGESHTVLGYYTLSAISVDIGEWPENVAKKLPRYPVFPATLMGRLAIDQRLQGQGAWGYLLMNALHRSLQASRQVAAVAVIVDAKDERAVAFYRRYEFVPFKDQPGRLFLPMGIIERLFTQKGAATVRTRVPQHLRRHFTKNADNLSIALKYSF